MEKETSPRFPSPHSEGYETWVRETALNAAVQVTASQFVHIETADQARMFTMLMVQQFEYYLNTGRTL